MGKLIDLTGRKFGRLIVRQRMDNNKWRHVCWLCKCDCGEYVVVTGNHLKRHETKSCGCLSKEKITRHGHNKNNKEKTRVYRAWNNLIQRCTNVRYRGYHNYGGRGIDVCERWLNSFENFLKDMGEPPTKDHSIDRIDNDRGYYKENCRWATQKQQMRNTRKNRFITFDGKTQCISAWSEETGINWKTIQKRLNLGWTEEDTLTKPVMKGIENDEKRKT